MPTQSVTSSEDHIDDERFNDVEDVDGLSDFYGDDDPDAIPADEQPGSPGDSARRWSFAAACIIGLAFGGCIFAWMLTADGPLLPEKDFSGSFFDIQGRAFLDGKLDVPTDSLGIEGFVVDGKTYLYFGPVPAVLRLPVLALTDRFDGRMSVVSIGLAWSVGAVFAALLLWRVRRFVRGDAEFTNLELAATILALMAYGGGSSLVILAARPIVYQEADVWGSALTLASLWAVIGVLEHLTYRRVALASTFATLAFLTRATLGLVATVALAAVTVAVATEWWSRRHHPGHESQRMFGRVHMGWLLLASLVLATALPISAYARVNQAKFNTPFRLPMETQVASSLDPQRQEMLRANGNSFFRPGFVPTTALTYFRPDGIRLAREYPFVFLPEQPQEPIGDYVFDRIDPTPGLFPTMPFWAGLAGWGLFTAFRPRPRCRTAVRRLRTPLIGAAFGTLGVLSIAFIAPRYLGDFIPFLVLAGAVGLYDVIERTDAHRRWVQRSLIAVLCTAAVFSVIVNVAIGYTIRSVESRSPSLRNYLEVRQMIGEHVGDPLAMRVEQGTQLSKQGGPDRLFIRGECDALYWSDGAPRAALAITNWRPIERNIEAGAHRVDVEFVAPASGGTSREPLLGVDDPLAPLTLYAEHQPDGRHVRFGFMRGDDEGARQSEPVPIEPGRSYDMTVVQDSQTGELSVTIDGRLAYHETSVLPGEQHLGKPGERPPAPATTVAAATTTKPGQPSTRQPTTSTRPTGMTSGASSTTTLAPANPSPGTPAGSKKPVPQMSESASSKLTPRSTETPLCRMLLEGIQRHP